MKKYILLQLAAFYLILNYAHAQDHQGRVPYKIYDNFNTGETFTWEPYPYQQDTGYDPAFSTKKEPAYGMKGSSLYRITRPNDALDLSQGFTKRIDLYTMGSTRVKFVFFMMSDRKPETMEVNFLKDHLFDHVSCREVHYMNGNAPDIQQECKRYADLLVKYPADIVVLGIGENTHLAFNDPHAADFNDPLIVKVVDLDEDCRTQQVNDGCFTSIEEVPAHALTITMPALFKSTYAYAIVQGSFKANAIYHTINSDISELYPSTILRKHDDATLFIDENSASKL